MIATAAEAIDERDLRVLNRPAPKGQPEALELGLSFCVTQEDHSSATRSRRIVNHARNLATARLIQEGERSDTLPRVFEKTPAGWVRR